MIEVEEFKKNFKIYNLKDNNIIKIYYTNFNFSKIKSEIPDVIPLNNNILEKINKKENLNIKEFEGIKKLIFFYNSY